MSKRFTITPPNWPRELTFEEFKKSNPLITENQLIPLYNQYLTKFLSELKQQKIHFKQSKINHLLTEIKKSSLFEHVKSNAFGGESSSSAADPFTTSYSLTFDRDNEEYVSTTFDPDDYNLKDGFTVSFWVRPDELGSSRFAMGREPATNQRFNFGIHSNTKIHVAVGSNRQRNAIHGLTVDNWFYYAVTFAGGVNGDRFIYINGNLISPETGTATWNDDDEAAYLWFGARNKTNAVTPWTNGWKCGLTDVAIFNEAKDSNWITASYNNGVPTDLVNESGLVGYWRFEEGEGTTVNDLSGNGNHGTFGAIGSPNSDGNNTTALPTWSTNTPLS